jgi:hypothetical protein
MLNGVAKLDSRVILRNMNTGTETERLLAEAAEKIRRQAYAAGWRDAITAMNKAVAELVDPETLEDLEIRESKDAPTIIQPRSSDGPMPTQGSTPWYVLQAVRKRPGMTGLQVVSAVQEGGHNVSGASIRTSLGRLGQKRLIVARHKKWFPA